MTPAILLTVTLWVLLLAVPPLSAPASHDPYGLALATEINLRMVAGVTLTALIWLTLWVLS